MLAYGFRYYFTPLFGVLFTFPSRYLFAIGLPVVFSLARWSWLVQTGFLVPRPTQGTAINILPYAYRAVTSFGRLFQNRSAYVIYLISQPYYLLTAETARIWAHSISLAATPEITFVFYSSGYLDVSVPRVCPSVLQRYRLCGDGLPHSGTCGSIRICQSPQFIAACHALLRLREPRHPPYAFRNFLILRTLLQILL